MQVPATRKIEPLATVAFVEAEIVRFPYCFVASSVTLPPAVVRFLSEPSPKGLEPELRLVLMSSRNPLEHLFDEEMTVRPRVPPLRRKQILSACASETVESATAAPQS